jgi:hypothetical protein
MSIIRITISEAAPRRAREDGGRNGGTRAGTGEEIWANRGIPENVFVAASAARRPYFLGKRAACLQRRGPLRGWRPQGRGGSNPPFRTNNLQTSSCRVCGRGTSLLAGSVGCVFFASRCRSETTTRAKTLNAPRQTEPGLSRRRSSLKLPCHASSGSSGSGPTRQNS